MIHLFRIKRKKSGERGFVTVEFVAGVGFLVFPVVLGITVFPVWVERLSMAKVAAREAARTYVLTNDQVQATQVVKTIEGNYKIPENSMEVEFEGDPTERGGRVRATVTTKIPATSIPLLDFDRGVFTVEKSHVEMVDLYRSRQ